MGTGNGSWTALVPIRTFATGKTRLRKTLTQAGCSWDATELSQAFASDVMEALQGAAEIGEVIVVSDHPLVQWQSWTQPEDTDLNRGLEWAVERARGDLQARCVIVMADLPCLTAEDVDALLSTASAGFVRDADGTGTSLLIPAASTALRFGTDSAAQHAAVLPELTQWASPQLRRDVDDYSTLLSAIELGVGPHTAAITAP